MIVFVVMFFFELKIDWNLLFQVLKSKLVWRLWDVVQTPSPKPTLT